jgi:hypothetical protein
VSGRSNDLAFASSLANKAITGFSLGQEQQSLRHSSRSRAAPRRFTQRLMLIHAVGDRQPWREAVTV